MDALFMDLLKTADLEGSGCATLAKGDGESGLRCRLRAGALNFNAAILLASPRGFEPRLPP